VRILLTGRDGQIGWELQRCLAPLGEVVAPVRGELDLASVLDSPVTGRGVKAAPFSRRRTPKGT